MWQDWFNYYNRFVPLCWLSNLWQPDPPGCQRLSSHTCTQKHSICQNQNDLKKPSKYFCTVLLKLESTCGCVCMYICICKLKKSFTPVSNSCHSQEAEAEKKISTPNLLFRLCLRVMWWLLNLNLDIVMAHNCYSRLYTCKNTSMPLIFQVKNIWYF